MESTVEENSALAETLPAEAFTSRRVLERELETVFRRAWLFIPQRNASELREDSRSLADMLRTRGSRVPFTLLDKPFFLQRGWKDSKLRAFPNVCTHAWYPLVAGPGRGNALVCAQHGRQFDCAGKFLSQPGFKPVPGKFPRDCDDLKAFPVESWGPFLFTALGEPGAPLSRVLGPMRQSLKSLPIDHLKRRPLAGEIREVDGNWKQHAWNFMDKFHVTFIHRAPGGLADAIDLPSYKTELYEQSSLQWVYAKNPEHGFSPEQLPARFRDPQRPDKRVFALWWLIFPNLSLNFYPWGLSVNVYLPIPDAPERTLFLWYAFSWDDKKFERRNELWLGEQVDAEDIDAMAQVRRGARSGFAPRGAFSPTEEAGPHWFHRLVSQEIS